MAKARMNIPEKKKLLWTNDSPNSSFATKNVTLSSDDYDILEIYFKKNTTASKVYCQRIMKGNNTELMAFNDSVTYLEFNTRSFSRIDDTHYTINKPFWRSQTIGEQTTDVVIPLYIYGIKY